MRARTAALVTALVGLALLAGCYPGLDVDAYPTEDDTDLNCGAFYADLPQELLGQEQIAVRDDEAVAYGAPPIILRCGVTEPVDFEPTSRCDMVAEVGWFTEQTADGYLFTTIGREYRISVEVPEYYEPVAAALVELAPTIRRHNPVEQPCV